MKNILSQEQNQVSSIDLPINTMYCILNYKYAICSKNIPKLIKSKRQTLATQKEFAELLGLKIK